MEGYASCVNDVSERGIEFARNVVLLMAEIEMPELVEKLRKEAAS